MIPSAYITEWRQFAPRVDDAQVEQDLILCRAMVSLFQHPDLQKSLALRGGTDSVRYSEDIDLVQTRAAAIGNQIDAVRDALGSFLGTAFKRTQKQNSVTLTYRFTSEGPPEVPLRLKIEINTREHFALMGFRSRPFEMKSRWFSGKCETTTFALEELLATKVRALYQRRKGRDLFDLWLGLQNPDVDVNQVVKTFREYLAAAGLKLSRIELEENLNAKRKHPDFTADITPLLSNAVDYNFEDAFVFVSEKLLTSFSSE